MHDTLGVTPTYALNPNAGEWGAGGNWLYFLFFLLAFNNGGFGGNANTNQINNDFIYSNLSNQIGRVDNTLQQIGTNLNNGLCNIGYQNLSNFKDMQFVTQNGFNALQSAIDSCCCTTNRNLDSLRYEMQRNTCDIIVNADKNTDRIIAQMTAKEVQDLRDAKTALELQVSQQAQTANIINMLRPYPMPAYITCSPYQTTPTTPTTPGA